MIEYEHAVCVYPFTMMLPNGRSRSIQEGTIAIYKEGKWFVGPTNVDTYIKSYFKPLNNWN